MLSMSDVRHTDVEVQNPSTLQQRQDAAQRQADREVADDEEAVNVRIGNTGTVDPGARRETGSDQSRFSTNETVRVRRDPSRLRGLTAPPIIAMYVSW
jgi:hypothetical protein